MHKNSIFQTIMPKTETCSHPAVVVSVSAQYNRYPYNARSDTVCTCKTELCSRTVFRISFHSKQKVGFHFSTVEVAFYEQKRAEVLAF